eukprot:PITA_05917
MKFTIWNIRGLGSKRKQRFLNNKMQQAAPDIIFVQETKCSIQKLKQIHSKWLNRFEFLEFKARNIVGGILTLWNPQKIGIIDAQATRNYLSVVIQPVGDKDPYLVTNVYGLQRLDDKIRFLDFLVDLQARHQGLPWVIGGDFNMIRSLSEKNGCTRALNKYSSTFQIFLVDMKLVDIDTNNGFCTWNNKRGGNSQVASKLDRFMISEDLMLLDKEIMAEILPFGGSDHWPVQMEIKGIGTPRNRPFRFENIWLSHPDFSSSIENWWTEDLHIQGSTMFMLHKRLKHIKMRLKDWNKNEFGNIFAGKKAVESKILKLNQALIKEGFDKEKNDQENSLVREPFIKDFTKHIPKLVSRENINLNRSVIEREVSEVLKEMKNGKAPGPDGFNVDFFKVCWNIVKKDIVRVVEDSRLNRTILKALNTSFIALIPKQDNVQMPERYRPIALCDVVYKIFSKVVANRLKPLLPTLVSRE